MSKQPTLFDEPELLPDLPGMIQGVVGVKKLPDGAPTWGRNEYTLQCQDCYETEAVSPLAAMRFQFPHCQEPRRRLCPDCHKQICDGTRRCRGMPGMRGHHD